jgi:hypothetical protein
MNKYQKEFISMDGEVFYADVYRVLKAFEVTCPAVQHAVKKLLMPGQRGSKDKRQDLNEALMSVLEALSMECVRLPEDGTLTDEAEPETETEAEAEPETEVGRQLRALDKWAKEWAEQERKPKPKLVTWRRCVRIHPFQISDRSFSNKWHPSGNIPEHWYPIEANTQPIGTVKQLPEGQDP